MLPLPEQRAREVFRTCYGAEVELTLLSGINNFVYRGSFSGQSRILKLARPQHRSRLAREVSLLRELARHDLPVAQIEESPGCSDDGWSYFVMRDAGAGTLADQAGARTPRSTAAFAQMGALLAQVHALRGDSQLGSLVARRDGAAYVREMRRIRRWAEASGLLDARSLGRLTELAHALPELATDGFCHNDFHAVQCVVHDGAISALVDWEEASLGNALADVAITQANLAPYTHAANREAFSAAYFAAATLARPADYERVQTVIAAHQALALARARCNRQHDRRVMQALDAALHAALS